MGLAAMLSLLLIILATLMEVSFLLKWPKAEESTPTSTDKLLCHKTILAGKDKEKTYHDIYLLLVPISFRDSLMIERLNK